MTVINNNREVKIENGNEIWEKASKARKQIEEQCEQPFLSNIPTHKLIMEILKRGAARFYYHKSKSEIYIRITEEAYGLQNAPQTKLPIPEHWGRHFHISEF